MAGKAVALGPGIPSIEAQEKRDRVPGGLYGPGWSSGGHPADSRLVERDYANGPTTGLLGESRIASAINSIAVCC